jgi:hypothetical protein
MENLDTVFEGKELEDLVVVAPAKELNLLEPTLEEKEAILAGLVAGKSYKEIRKTVRRVEMDGEKQVSAKGFSYGQIKEIDMARLAKIAELTAPEVVE